MVSDVLAFLGVESFHIMGKHVKPHSSMLGNRLERYEDWIRQE